MATARRILIVPRGAYEDETVYNPLDLVFYKGNSWVAKARTVGLAPSDGSERWFKFTDIEIENSLDAEEPGKVLDAYQGVVLKGLIESAAAGLEEKLKTLFMAADIVINERIDELEERVSALEG